MDILRFKLDGLTQYQYCEAHLKIINHFLPAQVTNKEIEVLAYFMALSGDLIEQDRFGTQARKDIRTKIGISNGGIGNQSTLFVKWDKDGHGAGFVYAYEISSFGCQQLSTLQAKYTGVRVNKVAEATARFLADATDYCTDDGGTYLGLELKGLAPYRLIYKIDNVVQAPVDVLQTDLKDLDEDGEIDDYELIVPGWAGITTDKNIVFMIETISSEGAEGTIGSFGTHTVHVHPLPDKPIITINN